LWKWLVLHRSSSSSASREWWLLRLHCSAMLLLVWREAREGMLYLLVGRHGWHAGLRCWEGTTTAVMLLKATESRIVVVAAVVAALFHHLGVSCGQH
jgi:hypothetical protein